MNVYLRFPEGRPKALTFSYDDGVEEDRRLVDIFQSHGLYGTFNVNSGLFTARENGLTEEGVKGLYLPAGQELACHGLTHGCLEDLPEDGALYEVMEDRRRLEALTGGIVRGMAYPYGAFSDRTVALLRAAGIAYCRTVISTGDFRLPEDWLRLTATCHHDDERLFELADRFTAQTPGSGEHGWLFYVWGHSYEFTQKNNWERIETFADRVARREDVWYATNMQIFDYVTAFRSLRFSLDGRVVRNPSAQQVWFVHRILPSDPGKLCSVAPGQTLAIY